MRKLLLLAALSAPFLSSARASLVPLAWGDTPQVTFTVIFGLSGIGASAPYDPVGVEFENVNGFSADLLPDGYLRIVALVDITEEALLDFTHIKLSYRRLNGQTFGPIFPGLRVAVNDPIVFGFYTIPPVQLGTQWDIQVMNDIPEPSTFALCAAGGVALMWRRSRAKTRYPIVGRVQSYNRRETERDIGSEEPNSQTETTRGTPPATSPGAGTPAAHARAPSAAPAEPLHSNAQPLAILTAAATRAARAWRGRRNC